MAVGAFDGALPAYDEERPLLLVLRALGLGDLLTGLPALRALADAFPSHRRVLAMPAALEPLVRPSGVVHDVLVASGVCPLPAWLPSPDVAVNLHGRGPQSHRVLLALGPQRLIAFANPAVAASLDAPEWTEDEHEVTRWCRLLQENGIGADPRRLDLTPDPEPAVSHLQGATILHPGAASGARRWPPDRWAAVARHERLSGHVVLVTGGRDEVALAETVAGMGGLSASSVLAGRTSVTELAALVSSAGLVLSGDTGVAHLATAVGTPSVVLFGPTPPSRWGPPADRPIHRVLWAGRTGDPHARHPGPGLLSITVEHVLSAVDDVRGRRPFLARSSA